MIPWWWLAACSGPTDDTAKDVVAGDDDDTVGDDDDDTTPPPDTSDTGTPGTLDCTDGVWLPGAYWLIEAEVPVPDAGAPAMATDLAVDADGNPYLVLNRFDPITLDPVDLSLRWRVASDPITELPQNLDWSGIDDGSVLWRPTAQTLARAADGTFWFAGRVTDGSTVRPFAAQADLGAGRVTAWTLDPAVTDASVTAGPVFTPEGTWFLGTVRDPAVGETELVSWRIDAAGAVSQAFRATELADGDVDGAMIAGALAATGDGRVLFGGGTYTPSGLGERAFLYLGDAAGFAEVLSLEPAETGGAAGAIVAAEVRDPQLAFVWGATHVLGYDAATWRAFEGALADPEAAVEVDADGTTELALPADVAIHPSGAVFVGGTLVPDSGRLAVPYIRLGVGGAYTTTFQIEGFAPGRISSVEIEPDGEVWGLCTFSEDGVSATAIELVHLNCRL